MAAVPIVSDPEAAAQGRGPIVVFFVFVGIITKYIIGGSCWWQRSATVGASKDVRLEVIHPLAIDAFPPPVPFLGDSRCRSPTVCRMATFPIKCFRKWI